MYQHVQIPPPVGGRCLLLVATVGVLWFKEPISALKSVSLGLIGLGVIGLNLSGGKH